MILWVYREEAKGIFEVSLSDERVFSQGKNNGNGVIEVLIGYFSEGRVDVGVNREVAGEAKVMNKTVPSRDLFGDEA